MKNINKLVFATLLATSVFSTSCTDLDERLYSVIPQDEFGTTTEEMNALIGPAYGTLVNWVNDQFWYAQVSSDEYMIPARGLD